MKNLTVEGVMCATCAEWAATTIEQLRDRKINIAQYPEMKPFACPECKGTQWALTDRYIMPPIVLTKQEKDTGRYFIFIVTIVYMIVIGGIGWLLQ